MRNLLSAVLSRKGNPSSLPEREGVSQQSVLRRTMACFVLRLVNTVSYRADALGSFPSRCEEPPAAPLGTGSHERIRRRIYEAEHLARFGRRGETGNPRLSLRA